MRAAEEAGEGNGLKGKGFLDDAKKTGKRLFPAADFLRQCEAVGAGEHC